MIDSSLCLFVVTDSSVKHWNYPYCKFYFSINKHNLSNNYISLLFAHLRPKGVPVLYIDILSDSCVELFPYNK